ncbi:MAG: PDZ domain-containing protein, partial [Chloroflexota bacterium]
GFPVDVGGDIIIAADDQPIEAMDDLIAFLERHTQVGQAISLTILRDGNQEEVSVTLAPRPERSVVAPPQPQQDDQGEKQARQAWLGISGLALDPQLAGALELPAQQEGILIQQIEHGSPAHLAGLKGGFMPLSLEGRSVLAGGDVLLAIDDQAIANMATLAETLRQHEPGDEVTLRLLRDNQEIEVPITLADRPE